MSINQRLKVYFVKKDLHQAEVARDTGFSKQTISNIFNDKFSTSGEVIEKICQVYETLNPNWVITGRGEMEINDSNELVENGYIEDRIQKNESKIKNLETALMQMVDNLMETNAQLQKLIKSPKQAEADKIKDKFMKDNPDLMKFAGNIHQQKKKA